MFEILGNYQAGLFVNATEIVPSPEVISTLLNMFRDKALLPTTFHEIGPNSPTPQVRLRLNSSNNEWAINFASHRIDIVKNPVVASGKNLGDIEKFAEDAQEFFSRILGYFKKKGNRLTIITAGMLREMTNEQLSVVYSKLLRPLPFYAENVPFEWNSRSVSRSTISIREASEPINVITSIDRIKGQFFEPTSVMQFERILVSFDINTLAESEDNRFTAESLTEFFNGALQIRSDIIEQIRGLIND